MDPTATATIGGTAVEVTRLGLGTAPLGGWPEAITPERGAATIEAAWSAGLRYFDTAPFYGYGQSEVYLGEALRTRDRHSYVLSTKVGRLLEPRRPEHGPPLFHDARPFEAVFDFTYDGVMRSFEASLERLGIGSIDIALVHDPDDHLDEALDGAFVALAELRRDGVVGAIGAGMNWSAPLTYLVERAELDCVLLAGRYTLLDQGSLDDLLPAAAERGVSIVAGGVFNSGVLADPKPGATYDYAPASDEVMARATRLQQLCGDHGVPLAAAALQFTLAHPVVAAVVTGAKSPTEVEQNVEAVRTPVPAELWATLIEEGLIRADAPVPA
jgi:D-threo-aldose 1-dehydrogenase